MSQEVLDDLASNTMFPNRNMPINLLEAMLLLANISSVVYFVYFLGVFISKGMNYLRAIFL